MKRALRSGPVKVAAIVVLLFLGAAAVGSLRGAMPHPIPEWWSANTGLAHQQPMGDVRPAPETIRNGALETVPFPHPGASGTLQYSLDFLGATIVGIETPDAQADAVIIDVLCAGDQLSRQNTGAVVTNADGTRTPLATFRGFYARLEINRFTGVLPPGQHIGGEGAHVAGPYLRQGDPVVAGLSFITDPSDPFASYTAQNLASLAAIESSIGRQRDLGELTDFRFTLNSIDLWPLAP